MILINENNIMSAIKMHGIKSTVYIVEGKSDYIFLKNLGIPENNIFYFKTNDNELRISNKAKVIKAINIMNTKNQSAKGIVDQDYDIKQNIDNLLYYEATDLEMMVIKLGGLDKLICALEKNGLNTEDKNNFLNQFYSILFKIGIIRKTNSEKNMNMCFKNIDFTNYIKISDNRNFYCFNVDEYIKNLNYFEKKLNKNNVEILKNEIDSFYKTKYDKYYICRGHDAVKLFSFCTSQNLSFTDFDPKSNRTVEELLLLAFEREWICDTILGKELNIENRRF